jgi:hypothetical protein
MKMLVLISNTSWRTAALSPSRMSIEMPYYFTSFVTPRCLPPVKQWV